MSVAYFHQGTFTIYGWVTSCLIGWDLALPAIDRKQVQVTNGHDTDYSIRWLLPANITWWHHQMETFSALLALCAGNWMVSDEFPSQRPVTRSFNVFFDPHLNKRLSKELRRRWFETPLPPLWRHCGDSLACCYLRLLRNVNTNEIFKQHLRIFNTRKGGKYKFPWEIMMLGCVYSRQPPRHG